MNVDELKIQVAKIAWYHTIDLGHGVITPGVDDSGDRVRRLAIPSDLRGKTVLDVGAWDGIFSFEAERRGADRVLAVDSYAWSGKSWGTKDGFELARRALGSRVEDLTLDVLDLAPERVGRFDLVLLLGVLYHMRHPLLALERVASVTARHLILDTHADLVGHTRPAMAFYPGRELNDDSTNWWGPNPAAVVEMLASVGFRRVERIGAQRSAAYRLTRAVYHHLKGKNRLSLAYRQDRIVFHGFR